MDYKQIVVDKFAGLNSSIDPSLIKDEEARDILNLRHEKVGKLTTRDGYSIALFYSPLESDGIAQYSFVNAPEYNDLSDYQQVKEPQHATESIVDDVAVFTDKYLDSSNAYFADGAYNGISPNELAVRALLNNQGIIGLGEFCFDTYWDAIDCDRVMVYYVRSVDKDDNRNIGVFLFSPPFGKYKNQIIYPKDLVQKNDFIPNNNNANIVGPSALISPNPEGVFMSQILHAPDGNDSNNWIDRYVDINQYQFKLIISDRTNGDLQIRDAQTFDSNYQDRTNAAHSIHISANCKEKFEIDVVQLDNRFEIGNENDISNGVVSNMALYNFKPQTSLTIPYQINNPILTQSSAGTITSDGTTSNIYSTENSVYQFDDLMKPLEIKQEEYDDEKGIRQTQKSADVYLWSDYQLRYYPSTGRTLNPLVQANLPFTSEDNDANYYLTANDREFDKVNYLLPKLVKLNEKTNIAKNAPLGVWKYRFVWDFGDGIYSAPSAEMLAPDIMWSAIPTPNDKFQSQWQGKRIFLDNTAERPVTISGDNPLDATNFYPPSGDAASKTLLQGNSLLINRTDTPDTNGYLPQLLQTSSAHGAGSTSVSNLGALIKTVKNRLYPSSHLYASTANDGDEARYAVMYRIEQTGNISLRGNFAKNKDGKHCGLEISNLSKFNLTTPALQVFQGAPLITSDVNYLEITAKDEFDWASVNFPTDNIQLTIKDTYYSNNAATHKLFVNSDKEPLSSFLLMKPKIPAEVKNRLVYQGYIQLNAKINNITSDSSKTDYTGTVSGFSINVLLAAEKLALIEQLTAMFPSSLLFRAPRLGIAIPWQRIPIRAKKLLIFRTKATHKNDYSNQTYGLVDEVELSGDKVTELGIYTKDSTSPARSKGGCFYYFDNVMDDNLDFTTAPSDFEGISTPLRSRFNVNLNERQYYANYKKIYQAQQPKGHSYSQDIIKETIDKKYAHEFRVYTYNRSDLRTLQSARLRYNEYYNQRNTQLSRHQLEYKYENNTTTKVNYLPYTNSNGDTLLFDVSEHNQYYPNESLCSPIYDTQLRPGIYTKNLAYFTKTRLSFAPTVDYSIYGANKVANYYWQYPAGFDKDVVLAKLKNIWLILGDNVSSESDPSKWELISSGNTNVDLDIKVNIKPNTNPEEKELKIVVGGVTKVYDLGVSSEPFYIFGEYEDIPVVVLSDYVFNETSEPLQDGTFGPTASPKARIGATNYTSNNDQVFLAYNEVNGGAGFVVIDLIKKMDTYNEISLYEQYYNVPRDEVKSPYNNDTYKDDDYSIWFEKLSDVSEGHWTHFDNFINTIKISDGNNDDEGYYYYETGGILQDSLERYKTNFQFASLHNTLIYKGDAIDNIEFNRRSYGAWRFGYDNDTLKFLQFDKTQYYRMREANISEYFQEGKANDLNMLRNIYIGRLNYIQLWKINDVSTVSPLEFGWKEYVRENTYVPSDRNPSKGLLQYPYGRIICPIEIDYTTDSGLESLKRYESDPPPNVSATQFQYSLWNNNQDVYILNPTATFKQPYSSLALGVTVNGDIVEGKPHYSLEIANFLGE